jgi:hypothetical protein
MNFNSFLILAPLKVQNLAFTKGFYSFTDAQYTRDGSQLIFSGDMDSIENPDRSLESEIYLADSDGNNFKMILGKEKQFSNASLSHWKMLAFLSSTTSFVSVPTLAVMPINGKNDIITIPFDRDKTNITGNDDKYLYFTSQSNGNYFK